MWVGGRRVTGSDSDWGHHLRTTGLGIHFVSKFFGFVTPHQTRDTGGDGNNGVGINHLRFDFSWMSGFGWGSVSD